MCFRYYVYVVVFFSVFCLKRAAAQSGSFVCTCFVSVYQKIS